MSEFWRIEKDFAFEAAHMLPRHDGKCKKLHGHSFKGRVGIASNGLVATGPKVGMVMDYSDIKTVLEPFVDTYLDHCYLNESTGLENPTSEELARWIYLYLLDKLPGLVYVTVFETCTSSCRYSNYSLDEVDAKR